MTGGFIVRTAGEGQTERDIAADMTFLYNLWLDIRQKAESKPAPVLAHHDLDIVQRLLRDQFAEDFKAVWMDSEEVYESVLRFVERLHPNMVPHVKLYTRVGPHLRRLQHHRRTGEGPAVEGLAEVGRLHRRQPDRSAGGHRRQHRQVRRQVQPPRGHHRQDQYGGDPRDRPPDPAARPGRHHRGRLHRHGRAQESPEGDAGARRGDAARPGAQQDPPVQRFRPGGHHPQAGQAEPGATRLCSPALPARAPATSRACRR